MNKNTLQRWQARQKSRSLKLLKELAKRIEKEQLLVNDAGFWHSSGTNEIIFRFVTISRDSIQDSDEIEKLL